MFRVGSKVMKYGDEVVELSVAPSTSTALYEIKYTFPSELAHTTTDLQSLMRGINPDKLSVMSRFGKGLYLAEDSGTALLEVTGKSGVEAVVSYGIDASKARVLDLSNPIVANAYGYMAGAERSITQTIGRTALNNGYNVVKYESTKNPGKFCYAVIDEFDKVLKPNF